MHENRLDARGMVTAQIHAKTYAKRTMLNGARGRGGRGAERKGEGEGGRDAKERNVASFLNLEAHADECMHSSVAQRIRASIAQDARPTTEPRAREAHGRGD